MKKINNGFLYVASKDKIFLTAARYSVTSLKDYWPESHVTLFTHKDWVKKEDYELFDNIITKDVPNHARAKLWALDKTPYKLTCYMDADTVIQHSNIKNIFKQFKKSSDITLTKARAYSASIDSTFSEGELTDHCGLFIYNDKSRTLNFMKNWWKLFNKQIQGKWQWDTRKYPEYFRQFDMWTYWWLQNKTDFKIKRSFFSKPDAIWNFIYNYKDEEAEGKDIVVYHQPVPRSEINQ